MTSFGFHNAILFADQKLAKLIDETIQAVTEEGVEVDHIVLRSDVVKIFGHPLLFGYPVEISEDCEGVSQIIFKRDVHS